MKELLEIRKKNKMKQIDFAKEVDMSQAYLSRVETGELKPNVKLLSKLRKVFGFNVNKWIDGK